MGKFADLLATGKPVILDGAGGTELERRGAPDPLLLWSATGTLTAPEMVVEIHRDMIAAGSQIITTQTFATTRRRFSRVGMPEQAEAATREAVRLARRARDEAGTPGVLIAGSYSPLEHCYHPTQAPDEETALLEHRATVSWLASEGVDLLLAETFNTIHEARAALRAGREAGLDVIVGFCCVAGGRLISGEPVSLAVQELAPLGSAGFAINCAPVAITTRALADLRRATDLPVGAYANCGDWSNETWSRVFGKWTIFDIDPGAYVQHATNWLALGADFVGGCCGTTPEHIAALTRRLRADLVVAA